RVQAQRDRFKLLGFLRDQLCCPFSKRRFGRAVVGRIMKGSLSLDLPPFGGREVRASRRPGAFRDRVCRAPPNATTLVKSVSFAHRANLSSVIRTLSPQGMPPAARMTWNALRREQS